MNALEHIRPKDFLDLKSMATERDCPVTLVDAVPRLAYFLHACSSKAACTEKRLD